MDDHATALDLSGLMVHTVEATPATSLDTAADAHGMTELAASCRCGSAFLPEDWDWTEA
jgi:hypothetical protein